jgi:hypothetical protein
MGLRHTMGYFPQKTITHNYVGSIVCSHASSGGPAEFLKKGGPTTYSGQFVLKSSQKRGGGSGPPGPPWICPCLGACRDTYTGPHGYVILRNQLSESLHNTIILQAVMAYEVKGRSR